MSNRKRRAIPKAEAEPKRSSFFTEFDMAAYEAELRRLSNERAKRAVEQAFWNTDPVKWNDVATLGKRGTHWAADQLLKGYEVTLALGVSRANMILRAEDDPLLVEPPTTIRVKRTGIVLRRDAYVLQYIYNGEVAELEVDRQALLEADGEQLMVWADHALMG